MLLHFVGGPYDGMRRAPIECRDLMSFLDIRTRRGLRKFVMLPALADWPGVVAGSSQLRDSRHFYYYELTVDRRSWMYFYDHDARSYREAIFDAF